MQLPSTNIWADKPQTASSSQLLRACLAANEEVLVYKKSCTSVDVDVRGDQLLQSWWLATQETLCCTFLTMYGCIKVDSAQSAGC